MMQVRLCARWRKGDLKLRVTKDDIFNAFKVLKFEADIPSGGRGFYV